MSKRKRKVFYEVSIPDMWWCGKEFGWVKELGTVPYKWASSCRRFRTAKRATAHATAAPSGTTLLQWSFKRGKRRLKEYTKI